MLPCQYAGQLTTFRLGRVVSLILCILILLFIVMWTWSLSGMQVTLT